MNILEGITHAAKPYPGVLLDAYGVFWGGNAFGLLPGSKEAMERLVVEGKTVGILSNATQLAAKEIDKLAQHGIVQGKHYHFLLTSGEIARAFLAQGKLPFATPHKRFYVFGAHHPKFSSHQGIFAGSAYLETDLLEEADFIYLAIPHIGGADQEDPDVFRNAVRKLREKNLWMICPNPDLFAHEGSPPRQVVRQGSIARLYEEMGGQVFYIGKPHPTAYTYAMARFLPFRIEKAASILMVGDTPETDIRGAKAFGMAAALVTETGMMGDRIRHKGLANALAQLPPGDHPTYYINRLV